MTTTRLHLAEALAEHYHAGQFYGVNMSYFQYHITGVVNQMKVHNMNEESLIVAFLHDIVEDTSCSIETIKSLFGESIANAVLAVTKTPGEDRDTYLSRCAKNKLARVVKLHDALFNATNCLKNKNIEKYNYYLDTISKLRA